MTTYAEYRAFATSDYWLDKRDAARSRENVINNTGLTRQVRRQRQREAEKPITLSPRLEGALLHLNPGQGLFMTAPYSRITGQRHKRYQPGYSSERIEPSADHSKRYAALFPVLPDTPDL